MIHSKTTLSSRRPLTTLTSLVILGLLSIALAPAAMAQEATPYLTKMLVMYDSPFKADYSMTMQMNQGGMDMSMNGKGEMTYLDPTHLHMNVDMTMKMPGNDQGMSMSMTSISDGTNTWTEMNNPMTGKQVMKMNIAKAQEMAAEQGMMANAGSSPLEQLRTLQEYYDFKVKSKAGGKVTLFGTMKDSAPDTLKQGGAMVEGLTLVLNEGSGMIERFEMGPAGDPAMVLSISNYKKLSKAEVPAKMFQYTPPAGANVIDPLAIRPQ